MRGKEAIILDRHGRALKQKKPWGWRTLSIVILLLLALCGAIGWFSARLSEVETIRTFFGWKPLRVPIVGHSHLILQGAYAARALQSDGVVVTASAFPSLTNPFIHDPRCFSKAVIEFAVTNPNEYEMSINAVVHDVEYVAVTDVELGIGPLIGGADFAVYVCTMSASNGMVHASLRKPQADYIKLSAGEQERIRVELQAAESGLYRVRAFCDYTVGRKSGRVLVFDMNEPILFFAEIPQDGFNRQSRTRSEVH